FSSNRNGNHDIWVIELDSHNPTVDLSIQDIRPVQVIFNCDLDENGIVDFVAGKPFAVQVKVSISNAEAVEYIVYELLMDGKSSAKGVTNLIDDSFVIYPDDTFDEGTHVITVKINAYNQINEVDENNNVLSETVNVHNINKLDLVYIPVDKTALGALNLNPASYGPLDLDKYESTVEDSNLFIKATYPIPELVSEKVNVEYYGSDIPFVGTLSDMIDIWLMGELITDTLADRSIGVVPHGYFKYHLLDDASGLYYWPINAGLVEVEFPTTTAHEIGHSYGLRLPIIGPGEEYNTNPNDRNSNGIWVNEKQFMSYKMCFMNSGQIFSSSRLTSASLDRWVCDDDYEDLFVSFLTSYTPTTSLPFTKDNVILCSGVVYKNGTIDLMPTYFVENGFADEVPSGDYSLKMFDMNEDVISEILFDVQFFVTADSSGTIETDFSGFAFVASYPEETTSISIEHEGETLVKFNPHSKLLHDAVDSIPDEGFAKNPNQRRNTLHNKIDAFEKLLDERSYEEAQLKLEGDIKDKVEKWVVDDYQTDNPLQLSKEEVLALISEEEARIELISGQ
ncbi:MAG: hypothetical protein QCI00_08895, partial [Candidatus Thermoplasmatota archaeon]|nr:hypothetical protein [Candidatus Thermoplasmatota archaeon]